MMSLPSSEKEWLELIAQGELVQTYKQNERIQEALRLAGLEPTAENVQRVIMLSRALMYPHPRANNSAQSGSFVGSLEKVDNQLA